MSMLNTSDDNDNEDEKLVKLIPSDQVHANEDTENPSSQLQDASKKKPTSGCKKCLDSCIIMWVILLVIDLD